LVAAVVLAAVDGADAAVVHDRDEVGDVLVDGVVEHRHLRVACFQAGQAVYAGVRVPLRLRHARQATGTGGWLPGFWGAAAAGGLRRTLAAMSDDDDAPAAPSAAVPAAPAIVPPVSKGWSEQDRRTLIITIAGTLAANVATVLLVGAALAWVHSGKTQGSQLLVPTLGALVVGPVAIVMGSFSRRRARRVGTSFLWGEPWLNGWPVIVLGWLVELVAVMTLIGLAAGVK
jgi:hypothetical protein